MLSLDERDLASGASTAEAVGGPKGGGLGFPHKKEACLSLRRSLLAHDGGRFLRASPPEKKGLLFLLDGREEAPLSRSRKCDAEFSSLRESFNPFQDWKGNERREVFSSFRPGEKRGGHKTSPLPSEIREK